MRAAVSVSAALPLALRELPPRPLRRGEVRVRTGAIGVNPVDWKMREAGPLYFAYQLLGPSRLRSERAIHAVTAGTGRHAAVSSETSGGRTAHWSGRTTTSSA